ncbi:YraN family protein [Paraeggerthella hongkongensis]|uniref:UPF0102 protein DMP08_02230 n=1 Tax=Paraeggerthella hongkongensis TaxID=230658 RepID=A0A3N0BJH6_9ACTN|nr:YraN family protein [Paraeggerthella hongkongensis]RNL48446.1 YraN family protein [Paraeggerthella hongkongensis]
MEDRAGVTERAVASARDEGARREDRSGDDRGRKQGRGRKKGSDGASSADSHNIELGKRGEDAAARFLYRRGYEIVERNWTCSAGEADIIARDEEWVVFVEVKTRSSCEKGFPSEAVDPEKRKRYENIAALFLRDYDVVDVPVRFDVVSIVLVAPDRAMIRHHINAYSS